MGSLLDDLPSNGMFSKMHRGKHRTKNPQAYYATHDTSPPTDQIITTDKTNFLLLRFRAALKDRDARNMKRSVSNDLPASRTSPEKKHKH
mmetsp:Transcript_1305/g.4012  ORF Transcript_1305/g.4012 Transcript_1305/m.4012 type:complete len:90 (-) Transcript_1305:2251-2520(-)